jgi:diguanylate cyclase (GGDEF)-like protein
MDFKELSYYLQNVGKDPARLIFEDELTGLYNRRFLYNYLQQNIKWDSLDQQHVSLLMMDLDHFKSINDTYGHDAGDKALIYLAGIIREVAGQKSLPIRYAGDEFMILMPEKNKQTAIDVGKSLIRLVHNRPFQLNDEMELSITLSIGLACAPADARDHTALIQRADTALYYAKKAGRDRLANADDIPPQDVFVKTALQQLGKAKIAGRKNQLATVAEALKRFSQRRSEFLIAHGAPGMGKSMFLDAIQKSMAQSKSVLHVKVSGSPQELFRPYYIIGSVIFALLNLQEDKGESLFRSLSPAEQAHLSPIVPQFKEEGEKKKRENERAFREGVFRTIISLTYKLIDSKPTVIFIDDLHYCDEATLYVFRRMMTRQEVPIFICGAATDTPQEKGEEQQGVLSRFLSSFGQEMEIEKVLLSPLSEEDIHLHLRGVFPGVNPPKEFCKELYEITQGNPLFLSEILRKLLVDGRIALSGQQWSVEPPAKGYLPRSLDEIVRQKISSLDEESRLLLDQASVLGDGISLSALTGSTDMSEGRVLDFLDKAVSQGLISSDFQLSDEKVRFLSRQVLNITYGGILKNRKEKLHERVGAYQESLYERDLLPSATTLAYHFKRSANRDKARAYEQLQVSQSRAIFVPAEADGYVADGPSPAEVKPKEVPLDAEGALRVPSLLRQLLLAVRNVRLYPPGSRSVMIANQQAKEAVDMMLEKNELFSLFEIDRTLHINGKKADTTEYKAFADSSMRMLKGLELKGIVLKKGLSNYEFATIVQAFGRTSREEIEDGYWQTFIKEKGLEHMELVQVRYTLRVDGTRSGEDQECPELVAVEDMGARLDPEAIASIPDIMRSIMNAASSIKLYPLKSKATQSAVEQLMQSLQFILNNYQAITMAKVGDYLFVNDEKADTSNFEFVARSFLRLIVSIGLKSISFLRNVSKDELMAFVGALGQVPPIGANASYWKSLAKEQSISRILFDKRFYDMRLHHSVTHSDIFESAVPRNKGTKSVRRRFQTVEEGAPEESLDDLLDKMPQTIGDLLLEGDEKKINQVLKQILRDYLKSGAVARRKAITRCKGLMTGLNLPMQNQMAKTLENPLLLLLSQEEDPTVLSDLADFLHTLAKLLIQFAEYPLATRILLHLQNRYRKMSTADHEKYKFLAGVLNKPLEPKIEQLILNGFRSNEKSRQENAAQLIGGFGVVTAPLLVGIIRNEPDLRLRHLAASLLAEQGVEAVNELKKQFVLQTTTEERARILEVIDGVTSDLRTELMFAIHDGSHLVRDEALKLTERLNNGVAEKLLSEWMESKTTDIAIRAMKTLGSLRPAVAFKKILTTLTFSKEEDRLAACCQTLGQIGDPRGVDALLKVLSTPRFLFFGKKYGREVRASAAFALTQIHDKQIDGILTKYVNDRDPRVSEIARSRTSTREQSLEPRSQEAPDPKKP